MTRPAPRGRRRGARDGAARAYDRPVTDDGARAAFRRALDAHDRAAAMHDRAAEFFDRGGEPDRAAAEREKADAERRARAEAIRKHPDWL